DSIVRPPIFTNALGTPDPSRTPLPAATMIAEAVTLRRCPRKLPRAGLFAFSLFRHASEIRTPNLRLQQNRRPLSQKKSPGENPGLIHTIGLMATASSRRSS